MKTSMRPYSVTLLFGVAPIDLDPGSPGVLFIEGKDANLERIYEARPFILPTARPTVALTVRAAQKPIPH